jgi:hypothetical protein
MKDTDYRKVVELVWVGGGFLPANEKAIELAEQCRNGEIISFLEITNRDINFHRAYMSLLAFIYGYLPPQFKSVVPKDKFYQFLKHLKGNYKVLFSFKDGTKLVEYDSIAFGAMSERTFREYVKEQLPWIYSNIIGEFFSGEIYDSIISTIETEYEKFFAKL